LPDLVLIRLARVLRLSPNILVFERVDITVILFARLWPFF
jgi:hypothetical protein